MDFSDTGWKLIYQPSAALFQFIFGTIIFKVPPKISGASVAETMTDFKSHEQMLVCASLADYGCIWLVVLYFFYCIDVNIEQKKSHFWLWGFWLWATTWQQSKVDLLWATLFASAETTFRLNLVLAKTHFISNPVQEKEKESLPAILNWNSDVSGWWRLQLPWKCINLQMSGCLVKELQKLWAVTVP